jgi:small-conductance mechanosensitive channel
MALKGAVAVLAMGLPLYAGLRYFLYRRRLAASLNLSIGFFGLFILYGGLTFLLASPLAGYVEGPILTTYLFITCVLTALTIVELIDLFLVRHYLSTIKKTYVSPPMRAVIKLAIFCLAILPIMRFVLHFNPLALVAIPTIASAGIAFALQDTLKAFIAGVGLGNMIRLGEWIAFQDKEGRVIDISWARTTLETADGQRVFVPNNLLLSGVFLNYTTGNPANRQTFKVCASGETPPELVKETLLQCARSVPGVAQDPPPEAALLDYVDSGIQYGLFYWLDDYTRKPLVRDDVGTRLWHAFRRAGIVIPSPTRTVQIQKAPVAKQGV